MSKNSSNSSEGEGNTILSPRSKTCVKQVSPAIAWCFTLNNYSEEQIEKIQSSIETHCRVGFFNKEVGKKCGTPHLQGYIEFKKKNRPLGVFGIREIHWAKAKGNLDQNFKYCSKDANGLLEQMTYSYGQVIKKTLRVIKELRPWQASVCEIIDHEFAFQNDRTINWIYDKEGQAGKTQFCKYVWTKYKQTMIVTGGAYKDIACVLNGCEDEGRFDLNDDTVILFNIPRDADDNGMISYKALESLKDGLMTSTKYESNTKVFNSPVVWVFSNNLPEFEKLTQDRWQVWTICAGQLMPYHEALIGKSKVKNIVIKKIGKSVTFSP